MPQQIIFENGPGTWPWTTDVDLNTDPSYGPNLCGDIIYNIVPVAPQDDPSIPPLVTLRPDFYIDFTPTTAHAPGLYDFLLVGTLPNGIQAVAPFQVEVTLCQASLSTLNAQ